MVLATSRTPALWLLISILRRDPLPLVGILIVALVVGLVVALVVVLVVVLVAVLVVALVVAAGLIELLLLGIFAVSKLF